MFYRYFVDVGDFGNLCDLEKDVLVLRWVEFGLLNNDYFLGGGGGVGVGGGGEGNERCWGLVFIFGIDKCWVFYSIVCRFCIRVLGGF